MNGRRDRRSYLDELTPSRGRDPASSSVAKPQVVVPTLGQGFDVTTIGFLGESDAVAGNSKFPAFVVLEVPEQIERATVTALAVVGSPMWLWNNLAWWTLLIQTGPLQEWSPTARIDVGDTGAAPLAPVTVGGVRYSSYGSMANPRPISIRLSQRSVLSLQVYGRGTSYTGDGVQPITVDVRMVGTIHYQRGA